jgi:hypothetical protein
VIRYCLIHKILTDEHFVKISLIGIIYIYIYHLLPEHYRKYNVRRMSCQITLFCLVPLPVIHSKIYLLNWVTESMHEYITSYVDPSYGECIDCNKRTIHICLKCHYCYSCHFKIENIEKEQSRIRKHYRRQPREISEEYPVTFVTYKRNKINSNI